MVGLWGDGGAIRRFGNIPLGRGMLKTRTGALAK
jgi:hypothetical protein